MEKHWYVVHTYSGYENKVKANLEKRVESMGMQDKIFRVIVPEEEETDIKNGKKKVVKKKVFPGYVLVEVIMTMTPGMLYGIRQVSLGLLVHQDPVQSPLRCFRRN